MPGISSCCQLRRRASSTDHTMPRSTRFWNAGLAPGALVVTVAGIEDASLALRPQPRPRLPRLAVDALHDHGAVCPEAERRKRLFPRRERLQALHQRIGPAARFRR